MDRIKQRQNLGYLIAGIGALVALLAFLLLPYAVVTFTFKLNPGSIFSSVSQYVISVTYNATGLTQGSSNNTSLLNSTSNYSGQGILWLLPLLALVALVLTGLLLFRDQPFGKGVNAPVANQKRWGNYGLIGAAVLSVLIQIISFSSLSGQIQSAVNASSSSSGSSVSTTIVSTGTHIGFWLFLLAMVAVAAGAIYLVMQENKQKQLTPSPNIAGVSSYPPVQSPAPLDPYSQPYPPQQAPAYPPQQASAYPSQQPQQYPSQQWPPSSNQPQPPYPSGQ